MHTNINQHLDLANNFLQPGKLSKQDANQLNDTQGRGVRGAGQSQFAECPKTTSPTDGFQKAQGWLWGHMENIVLSAQATTLFLFPAQRTSSSPDLLRDTDPVSSCCAFLAKIASRISRGVFPGCSASSKRSLVYRPQTVEAVKSDF